MGADCCKNTGASREVAENAVADDETVKFLSQVQLFKRLPPELIPSLATVSTRVNFGTGEAIISQGDEGHEFFIIVNGSANVLVDGKIVASLSSGDYFGENALLRNEARSATVKAASQVIALKIVRDNFRQLGLHERLEFPRRGAVAAGGGAEVIRKPPSNKTAEEKRLMENALRANANLKTMAELTTDQVNDLIAVAWKEDVMAGIEVIKQGDLDANYFYIVQEGSFEILVNQENKNVEQASAVGTVEKGGSFGELALLYFAPRAATVRAKTKAVVWVMDRVNFKNTLSKSSESASRSHMEYLKNVDVLSSLKDDERLEVAKALVEQVFSKGDIVMTQGEPGDNFYILIEGDCQVIKDGKETAMLKGSKKSPAFCGEQALLNNTPRTATIKVVSDTAVALVLDKAGFELVLGPLEAIKKRGAGGKSMVGQGSVSATNLADLEVKKRFGNIKRKDLKKLGLLGCGGFGAVELVEHVTSKETFALKALSKGYVVKSGMQKSVIAEKEVQIMCDSPFIVKLYETFNGEQSLYLLLELALGGELYATYNRKDFFGRETHAKFYVAGVVYGFDHMHSKKIIFRDLKPENLLLTQGGQIKITDMGLAKVVAGKTYTTCGTPDYFAPELIQSAGHSKALDWWTLGILTFELMVGRPPFESPSPMQIYQKVVRGINKVNFPPRIKPACVSLIKGLCRAEPSQRLPVTKGGIKNIMEHPWYEGFDWPSMKDLTMAVPYKPQVRSNKDVANFSARKEDMPPQVPYKDDGSGWDKTFATST